MSAISRSRYWFDGQRFTHRMKRGRWVKLTPDMPDQPQHAVIRHSSFVLRHSPL